MGRTTGISRNKSRGSPVRIACEFCHNKHLHCDVERPCQNCIKRNIGHTCKDVVKKGRQPSTYMGPNPRYLSNSDKIRSTFLSPTRNAPLKPILQDNNGAFNKYTRDVITFPVFTNSDKNDKWPGKFTTESNVNLPLKYTSQTPVLNTNAAVDNTASIPSTTTEEVKIDDSIFESLWTSEEYSKLNEILNIPDSYDYNIVSPQLTIPNLVSADNFTTNANNKQMSRSKRQYGVIVSPLADTDPATHMSLSNNKAMADFGVDEFCNPNVVEGSSPGNGQPKIKKPEDLYKYRDSIKPFDYKDSYLRLHQCLFKLFRDDKETLIKLMKDILEKYAPTLVALQTGMIKEDYISEEFYFQRVALDLESLTELYTCTPMMIWRRTGEIRFVSDEFSSLTGFNKKECLKFEGKERFVFEFWDNSTIIKYFDKFHHLLAFGSSEKCIHGNKICEDTFLRCKLLLKNGHYMECATCWTVKRDSFNIPLLIIGYFLPIFA
ncbi:Gsm1p NDAI_0G05400 [Naumovozyma dairenensis CBS 421]|uniref:Glucose starvation modulator protein 1 n=1 Tax=Naumovozyma dairenensis (strain ATCC 10597 / BCRC 20456 / CBS 421 / NBRC 0211 / NRRL Y-12639) TaxID=1071378 RepID=J7SB38_NAUDC|nr:hypothetical protein NDAI_0G05400 [Naumovozyma dairenensis CBS 421]CCK73523.1 hypothetical protein NDAI_0G05400 [Naumovozyma dairenensis CBS 421]